MSDEKPYKLDEQVGYLLRLASQRHAAIFQHYVPMGLTPTQFSAIIKLSELGICSQNQLGRLVSVDVATIKGVVDRLKKKDLVLLDRDASDKRRTLISLTEKGKDMVQSMATIGQAVTAETLRPLTAAESAKLIQLLAKIS